MKKKSISSNIPLSTSSKRTDKIAELIIKAETFTQNLITCNHSVNISTTTSKTKKSLKKRGNFDDELIEEKNIVKDQKHRKNYLFSQPGILKNGSLREFQLDGLNWLISLYETQLNGILADEMGLGKTVQTIGFLGYLIEYKEITRPFLIVTPKSTVPNWLKELKKWLPNVKSLFLSGIKAEREETLVLIKKKQFDVIVTTYEGAKINYAVLRKILWEYFVIDEGHKIKNEDSLISLVVRDFMAKGKLLLTGTPLQNNIHELWSLLNFLLPDFFENSEIFDEWFADNEASEKWTNEEKEKHNAELLLKLHRLIKPFILRRVKIDVEKSLPPKKEVYIYVGLTELQHGMYKNMLKERAVLSEDCKRTYLNIVMQLIKICNHPYLFDEIEGDDKPLYGDHLITVSGKMLVLDKLLHKLYLEKHQVLIFSQMTSVLDIIEDYCKYRNYTTCRIDGETSLADREAQMNDFTLPDSDKFIFLLSTRSGGLGINLASADTVILYDSDWNPQMDLQAMDRAHRIGQKNTVNVYRFITKGTIEERLNEKQLIKLKWDSLIVRQGHKKPNENKHFSKDDIKGMIDFGVSEIFSSEKGTYTDEDIDLILARGEAIAKENEEMLEEHLKKHKHLLDLNNFDVEPYSMYEFDDMNYAAKKNADLKVLNDLRKQELLKNKTSSKRRILNLSNTEENDVSNLSLDEILKLQNIKNNAIRKLPAHHFYENRENLLNLHIKQEAYYLYNRKNANAEPLMLEKEELEEKEKLMQTGFRKWNKAELMKLMQALDIYDKEDYSNISEVIETKNEEEVKEYMKVLFERIEELSIKQKNRILNSVKKLEDRGKIVNRAKELIKKKVESYDDYIEEIDIIDEELHKFQKRRYHYHNKDLWPLETDKYLIYWTNIHGYGNSHLIKTSLFQEKKFKFDHFLRTRNLREIEKRISNIVEYLELESKSKQDVEIVIKQINTPKATSKNQMKINDYFEKIEENDKNNVKNEEITEKSPKNHEKSEENIENKEKTVENLENLVKNEETAKIPSRKSMRKSALKREIINEIKEEFSEGLKSAKNKKKLK